MKVILTEKPSVARDIARCLAINHKRDGYFEGNGYQITWAFGHLVALKEPDDYHPEWKRWSLDALPIIPESFGLKAKGDDSAQKQLSTIKRLFKSADEIICATDAGREGELIFRYILAWSRCLTKPIKRLWISSLTDEAIHKGFTQLQASKTYDGLYRAAKCRSEADWIVGLNATRLYTLKFAEHGVLWTIGRVQTPVLAMIVAKDNAIARFVPTDFWELHTRYQDTDFLYLGGRFSEKNAAEALLAQLGTVFNITDVSGKRELIKAPLLYDLTDLQKDMNLRYGLTAEHTLACAQQLYEKKHITYPRTDSRYLSSDMKALMPTLLAQLRGLFAAQIDAPDVKTTALDKRYFNDAKVSDHHAIIPTSTLPHGLAVDEQKIYDAIALRFIAAFYPPCCKRITTVLGKVAPEIIFKTTGTVIEAQGWQALYHNAPLANANANEQKILPLFVVGDSGAHQPSISQGKTTPPKPFNEASLLTMMASAGKTCDDEALKEALKDKGLGTPATRAAIIEVLIKRNYIQRDKKWLLSTDTGRHLIGLIADERLKSAAMTGEWEAKLKRIERNDYDPDQFMADIIQFTQQLKDEAAKPLYDDSILGACPRCQRPIIEGRTAYGCSGWKLGCDYVLLKQFADVVITRTMASQLLQIGRTLNAVKLTQHDRVSRGCLTLTAHGNISYSAQPLTPSVAVDVSAALADCPLCDGKIIETAKAFSCSAWRNGCKMVIWKTIAHKKITPTMAKKLLIKGETGLLTGFKSNKGVEFAVNLKLIDGKVELDFSDA